jgi:hypothetical protein
MPFCTPRFSWHSSRIPPTCACGVRIVAVITGSSIFSMRVDVGSFDGVSISCVTPSLVVTRYSTPGARRDEILVELALEALLHDSMCSIPRNPQRKPKPSAADVSGSKKNEASFSRSFFERFRQLRVLRAFDRVQAREDHRLHFLEAGKRRGGRAPASVIVSPIFASARF